MTYAKIVFLLAGALLLGLVLREADLPDIAAQLGQLDPAGILLILAIYVLYFGSDVVGWQVTLRAVCADAMRAGHLFKATARLYAVRMIGEAYNNITPLGSMGGEPIKAWLLKQNYGVGLRDSGASLVLVKTASMSALVLFVATGFVLAVHGDRLTEQHQMVAALGLAWLSLLIGMFYLVQRLKLSTFAATRLGGTRLGQRLTRMVSGMQGIDDRFENFYTTQRPRLFVAMTFGMLSWIFGAVELYCILVLTGNPISMTEAWIIEAAVQLVRTITFFIPAGLGAQEGALFLSCGAILGTPSVGITIALVKRSRELVWISLGLLLASVFSVSPRIVAEHSASTAPNN